VENIKYERILIKLSGEALAGEKKFGLDDGILRAICQGIKKVKDLGVQIGIVVGGGNFWRGRTSETMDRTRADHMGMLATVINSLALADALEALGLDVRVQTAIEMASIAEPYIRNRAIRHMEKGRVVVFGCGTGCPFFSTDTASALRAAEIEADIIFKATMVDGVYNKDPVKYADAVKYKALTFKKFLDEELAVMDAAAASLCRENKIPILVFSIDDPDNIYKAVTGGDIGTVVTV
jgi:uridylate kinase